MRTINLLIDLSGTLHIGDSATPRAVAALTKLRAAVKERNEVRRGSTELRFCSNTTKESETDLLARLHRIGFADTRAHELFTSLSACRTLLERENLRPLLLLSSSAARSFTSLPHSVIASPSHSPSSVRSEIKKCDAVVLGLAPHVSNYDWLDEGFRLLAGEYDDEQAAEQGGKKNVRLIAAHVAQYYRASDGHLSLGPGAFVQVLESASKSGPATVCGKPSKAFFEACLEGTRGAEVKDTESGKRTREERNIIIGDDVEQDLGGGAIELGLERVLVRTGKYRKGDETRPDVPPAGVYDTFADWVDALLREDDFVKPRA